MADDDFDFFLCVGDELPSIQETLQNGDGSTPDLTGATTVFVIQDSNHVNAAFGGSATPVGSPTTAVVQYNWQSADVTALSNLGAFNYRWVVTFPGGKQETYPNGPRPRRLFVSSAT